MPLRDHFHPPLSQQRHWESFHATWASTLADALNEDWLPAGFFAEEHVTAGGRIEIDVATFTHAGSTAKADVGGGLLTLPAPVWTVPQPTFTVPTVDFEEFSVRIYSSEGGPKLVAAMELVSPANKDRAETRQAFLTKCAAYLHQRISLMVIDVVTSRTALLHRGLLEMLGSPTIQSELLFAAAYRPFTGDSGPVVEGWYEPLRIGAALPTLPLFIAADTAVAVDLESTYSLSLQRRRIDG